MAKDLQSIFEAITPSNIQDLDIIKDAMSIFIETLEELSAESIDIKNIYNNTKIREELIKIYLEDLYTVLKNIDLNKKLVEKIEYYNEFYGINYFDTDVIYNLVNYIKDEHFLCFKSFKEHKGTKVSIKYIYNLINVFINSDESTSTNFELNEVEPFVFEITGSMNSAFYDNIVRPLAHPMGFVYTYTQLLNLILEDYFPESGFNYIVKDLEVRCLKPDGSTYIVDYKYDEHGIARVVTDTYITTNDNERIKFVYFDDGTYLKQVTDETGQTSVFYMAADDSILVAFGDQCSIYFNYDFIFNTAVTDELNATDSKATSDYFARLDHRNWGGLNINQTDTSAYGLIPENIGDFYILTDWLHNNDRGFNIARNRDGDKLFNDDIGIENGRYEHYFSPSENADLKLLSGSFEKNVDIYNDDEFIEVQKIKYTDVINPEYASVNRVVSPITYANQNIGNEEYVAKEHFIDDHFYNVTTQQILIEPIYNGTANYIDYNEENRNDVPDPWGEIGEHLFIGTGYADTNTGMFINDMRFSVGENSPYFLETVVNGDTVNLQHETNDTLEFGVYRNNVLIEDNNVTSL